ncbi:MAG: 50S ribosomal protein L9 [Patescibacteria group bacterium]|jgi:large subunit ribosomal protein L9
MKIVYLENSKAHKRGDIKDVAEGYARNFLIPQGVAAPATAENLAKIKQETEKKAKTQESAINQYKLIAERIRGRKVEIKGKANESGKLYASITEQEVKIALKKLGLDIGKGKVIFPSHLKEAGEFKVKVDFGHDLVSEIIILVRV